MPTFYRVAAVEGRLVQHPASIGTGVVQMLGHTKSYGALTYPYGPGSEGVPSRVWAHSSDPVVVAETGDLFIRRAIVAGDLEYIESIEAASISAAVDGKGRTFIDPQLSRKAGE